MDAKLAEAKLAEAKLADQVRRAADVARRLTLAYPRGSRRDDFPFAVVAAFDTEIRGRVERDRRIEDERDRVLIAAVNFAETPADDEPEAAQPGAFPTPPMPAGGAVRGAAAPLVFDSPARVTATATASAGEEA